MTSAGEGVVKNATVKETIVVAEEVVVAGGWGGERVWR